MQTFLSTDPLPKNLSCLFLGLRGHLTQLTVPLAETLSERLGISVLCFAVLEVVCRARGADTECSGRAVLETVHKISSATTVCRALHLWL